MTTHRQASPIRAAIRPSPAGIDPARRVRPGRRPTNRSVVPTTVISNTIKRRRHVDRRRVVVLKRSRGNVRRAVPSLVGAMTTHRQASPIRAAIRPSRAGIDPARRVRPGRRPTNRSVVPTTVISNTIKRRRHVDRRRVVVLKRSRGNVRRAVPSLVGAMTTHRQASPIRAAIRPSRAGIDPARRVRPGRRRTNRSVVPTTVISNTIKRRRHVDRRRVVVLKRSRGNVRRAVPSLVGAMTTHRQASPIRAAIRPSRAGIDPARRVRPGRRPTNRGVVPTTVISNTIKRRRHVDRRRVVVLKRSRGNVRRAVPSLVGAMTTHRQASPIRAAEIRVEQVSIPLVASVPAVVQPTEALYQPP